MDVAAKSRRTNFGAQPVRVVAVETCGTTGSIALLEAGDEPIVYTDRKLPDDQRTARSLLPCLKQALEEQAWRPARGDLVCVTTRPGSVTGLRIGVVTAKTFAYATGAKLVGVHTLAAIAAGAGVSTGRLWTVLDAQRGELFAASFDMDKPVADSTPPETHIIAVPQWLERLKPGDFVAGPPVRKLKDRLPSGVIEAEESWWTPMAGATARVGLELFIRHGGVSPMELIPQYYRKSAAEEKARSKNQVPQ
jgi:tRNA threonylcarbamoyladenosine biosynthesis protein TsaB